MSIAKFVKNIYFLLFDFISGKTEKKISRFAAHLFTIWSLVCVIVYFQQAIIYFTSETIDVEGIFAFVVVAPIGLASLLCLAKRAILLGGK